MQTYPVAGNPLFRLCGRQDDCAQPGFSLYWSGSSATLCLNASGAEIEIDCVYTSMTPYVSIEVDGLRAATFVPLQGRHWYSLFEGHACGPHTVRIIKETQPFTADLSARVYLTQVRTDGEAVPAPARKRKLAFIGDSVTSAEGLRGPVSFNEWVPMVFGASDCYARRTADLVDADYQIISQSGWGVYCSWDNHPECAVPRLWEHTRLDGGTYDFSFRPDDIVIALGANDASALEQPAWTAPDGTVFKLTGSEQDMHRVRAASLDFLHLLHRHDPQARITWIGYLGRGPVTDMIRLAVSQAAAEGIPARWAGVLVPEEPVPTGSRQHPGRAYHDALAKALAQELLQNR